MTKIQHFNRTVAQIATYAPNLSLSPTVIYFFITMEIWKVWQMQVAVRPDDFRTELTCADGDPWPADWTLYANAAFYMNAGVRTTFHEIYPAQLGMAKKSTVNGAIASWPAIFFENQEINTFPVGLTGIKLQYISRPPAFFDASVADATDDGLPAHLTGMVHIAAADSLRQLSPNQAKAFETLLKRQVESLKGTKKFLQATAAKQSAKAQGLPK